MYETARSRARSASWQVLAQMERMMRERCQRSWKPVSATDAPSLRARPAFRLRRYWRLSLREQFSGKWMSAARIPTKPSACCNFFRLEELKDVAFLDVIEVFQKDT